MMELTKEQKDIALEVWREVHCFEAVQMQEQLFEVIKRFLAGYFLCLYEYIVMRHRVICAESDLYTRISLLYGKNADWKAFYYYWNRGTK